MAPGLIYVTKSRQVYFVTFYRSRAQIDRWLKFVQVDGSMSQCPPLLCIAARLSLFVVFVCFWIGLSRVFDLVR